MTPERPNRSGVVSYPTTQWPGPPNDMPTPLTPWLALRQVREALRTGQLDDARQQLEPWVAAGYRHALKLNRRLLVAFIQRGERHLRADQAEAAWRDLIAAESLDAGDAAVVQLRNTLTRLGLAETRAALEAGNPAGAVRAAAALRSHQGGGPELERLEDLAHEWVLASEQAARGDFLVARDTAARMRRGLESNLAESLAKYIDDLTDRYERFQTAFTHLREAAEIRDWVTAARHAEEAIALAPQHREARILRQRAWELIPSQLVENEPDLQLVLPVVEARNSPNVARSPRPDRTTQSWTPQPSPFGLSGNGSSSGSGENPKGLRRFLLWVDGVGGYLVCMMPRVTFGQATSGAPVDVPIFADVASLHAELTRDSEGYVLECGAGKGVQVNGRAIRRESLTCGDRLTLGATCQFVFRRPVAISPTAKLEVVSGHRMPMAVDGVLLMAESLILGEAGRSHVALPGCGPDGVVLYRTRDGLGVRCGVPFHVDGRPIEGRTPLILPAVVSGEAFCFALEPVGTRLG